MSCYDMSKGLLKPNVNACERDEAIVAELRNNEQCREKRSALFRRQKKVRHFRTSLLPGQVLETRIVASIRKVSECWKEIPKVIQSIMPKSLAKVHKQISKKTKGNISSLHENSRNSQRLRRAGARDDKLARVSKARAKANRPHRQCWPLLRVG